MDKRWLKCSVSPGQFPTEYAVSGTQHDGKPFSLFAPTGTVKGPSGGTEGVGYVEVSVIDLRAGLAIVRLPAQTFENGHHVTVSESALVAQPAA